MSEVENFQEHYHEATERDNNPLNLDIDMVGESNVEGGEIPLNQTECALAALSEGRLVKKQRSLFLEPKKAA